MNQNEKSEKVHSVFEKIYSRYDRMNSIISFKRHKAWRKDVMKKMNVHSGEKCLDVCCGTGDWTIALANEVGENGQAIGLDFSQNMLSVGHQKKKDLKLDQVNFIHGDAMQLPFEDNSFDYVTIGFGLRNVPDYMQVIKEMYRVVKPGGSVVCLETSQPTLPVYKQLYFFYFKHIMPLFGKLFAKSYEEYAWLHESTKGFPDKETLRKMFLDAGFKSVQVKSYALGAAAMHLAKK
ncbi:bifunctional demethylmenaquinone methyltransferase/2-methoxy-6-polyprenyl-1,4-benzoquinol methylase [Halalkalibacillus sediminis]|uniref:Demethylmenaquinone methyltransferase n=1 Tax=Halalkalibacillus sediminis TaxID=2018042 RepID=A0A2I0QWX9_9BACI|nr:demethylmenaquinone methyltransferase [Halalkalibacillus sediminis]PKR78852.1 bifunctional demethylmenaquinone methyltransferase/2-methoxy-6-polyprenyl-1,4-benzoquinol methylase [Halalkalibacillus sediminis]